MTGLILASLLTLPLPHLQRMGDSTQFYQCVSGVIARDSEAAHALLKLNAGVFKFGVGHVQRVPKKCHRLSDVLDGFPATVLKHEPLNPIHAPKYTLTQDPVQQSKRHNWDLGLTFVSLTGSAIATGITASCTSTNECRELNPILRRVIKDDGIAKAVILKSSLNAGMHFLILRYMPEGRWRTVSLAVVAGINWLDAGNDIREMRKIVRNR